MGRAVVIEIDVELRERLRELLVVRARVGFGISVGVGGVECDRRSVHVGSTDERRLLPETVECARERVAAHERAEMPDVEVTVRVRQPAGDDRRRVSGVVVACHGYTTPV